MFDIFARTTKRNLQFKKYVNHRQKLLETFGRHDNAKIPLAGNKSALSKHKIGHEIYCNLIHVLLDFVGKGNTRKFIAVSFIS